MEILAKLNVNAMGDEDAIAQMIDLLCVKGFVKESYLQNVIDREKVYPTGLRLEGGIDVALPHGNAEHVNKLSIAVGVLKKPVVFHQMGSDPKENDLVNAKLIFVLACNEPKLLVPYLSKLTTDVFQKPEVLKGINEAETEDEVARIMKAAIGA